MKRTVRRVLSLVAFKTYGRRIWTSDKKKYECILGISDRSVYTCLYKTEFPT